MVAMREALLGPDLRRARRVFGHRRAYVYRSNEWARRVGYKTADHRTLTRFFTMVIFYLTLKQFLEMLLRVSQPPDRGYEVTGRMRAQLRSSPARGGPVVAYSFRQPPHCGHHPRRGLQNSPATLLITNSVVPLLVFQLKPLHFTRSASCSNGFRVPLRAS
jgi:hypothetical protein